MSKILVPPELLFRVANEFHTASIQLEWTINLLNQQISTMLVWDGTTRQRFFDDFQRARNEMTLTIEYMKVISEELKKIANKFILIDDKSNPLYMPRYSDFKPFVSGEESEPKTWQDYAEELWEGAKSGGKMLADSVSDTVESLIEDPLGTGGQMLYNATIGTVEEVIDTAVWGTKMVFDVGDTREKFDEEINETGGMANYLGEQGALFAGGVLLRRVGVKNRHALKHDSGGDGGRPLKKDEGTPKANGQYSGELVKVPKGDEAADMLSKKLGGQSRVKFSNDPNRREFDTISDQYIAQTKPPLNSLDKQFRKQAKATIEAAIETGRKAYFHFEGKPDDRVLRQLKEYAERYGVEIIIDTKPLKP
ncbi:Uncharacterized conserved protein YukE [Paenibacillus uliginis N3/975]|uniref:Uncharacterized conserved protein YukE n=1 Tax=Paenibacillus uliginis N3/975 TaxID=1313296 RepID=A0A1X7HNX2_9BACL|nr:restriction endonuclease fold toxin [Paenibacillus uliginis]SMF90179.1 Uncharacterized conserved protein YukE [Paenibacillus uliginis N3/975]